MFSSGHLGLEEKGQEKMTGLLLASFCSHSQRKDEAYLLHGYMLPGAVRIRIFPTPPAKTICLTFCLTDSEAINYTASTQLAINWRPELD
jgi:hypothetical protein